MRWKFHAQDTSAQADEEVADCGFEGEDGIAFGLMTEDDDHVRMSWRNGDDGADEDIIGLGAVRLAPGRVSIDFKRTSESMTEIPYEGIDVTYDDVDERSEDLADVFSRLLAAHPKRLKIER